MTISAKGMQKMCLGDRFRTPTILVLPPNTYSEHQKVEKIKKTESLAYKLLFSNSCFWKC